MAEQSLVIFFKINRSDLNRFQKQSVYLSRPRILRLYKVENDKIMLAKTIKYFREPKASDYPLDLNVPLDRYNFSRLPYETKVLMCFHNEITTSANKALPKSRANIAGERTAVFARRGSLRYIMEFCYEQKFDSRIQIVRHNRILYLVAVENELQDYEKTSRFTNNVRLRRQVYVDKPNGLPDLNSPYNSYIEDHILHRSELGKFDLTYAGEMDGIISDAEFDKIDDINEVNKLKFAMTKQMWKPLKNQDFKYLSYWTQAILVNIEDLYIAYNDNNGVVREPIQHLKVSQMPKNRRWKPRVCTSFLNEFLDRVEKLMWNVDSFEIVYDFYFNAKDKTIYYEIHRGKAGDLNEIVKKNVMI